MRHFNIIVWGAQYQFDLDYVWKVTGLWDNHKSFSFLFLGGGEVLASTRRELKMFFPKKKITTSVCIHKHEK